MGKNQNASAGATAGSSGTTAIDKLKTLNDQLVQEVACRRKKIEELKLQIDSLAAEQDIQAAMERDVFALVLSHGLQEAETHSHKAMAAATDELEAAEMGILALLREKDAIHRGKKRMAAEMDATLRSFEEELARKKAADAGRRWKKWVFPVCAVAAASLCVITAIAAIGCSIASKH